MMIHTTLRPHRFDRIPDEIVDDFVLWRRLDGKKPPICPRSGQPKKDWQDTCLLRRFEAVRHFENGTGDGIGFLVRPGILALDFDSPREWVIFLESVGGEIPSYAERSPGGVGIHCYFEVPRSLRVHCHPGEVGLYTHGQYVTLTGDALEGSPYDVREASPAVLEWVAEKAAESEALKVKKAEVDLLPWDALDGEEVSLDLLQTNDDAQRNAATIRYLRDGVGRSPKAGGRYGWNKVAAAVGMASHSAWRALGQVESDRASFDYVRTWKACEEVSDSALRSLVVAFEVRTSFYDRKKIRPGWNQQTVPGIVNSLAEVLPRDLSQPMTRRSIEDLLGIGKSGMVDQLKHLEEAGLIGRVGAGCAAAWLFTEGGQAEIRTAQMKLALASSGPAPDAFGDRSAPHSSVPGGGRRSGVKQGGKWRFAYTKDPPEVYAPVD